MQATTERARVISWGAQTDHLYRRRWRWVLRGFLRNNAGRGIWEIRGWDITLPFGGNDVVLLRSRRRRRRHKGLPLTGRSCGGEIPRLQDCFEKIWGMHLGQSVFWKRKQKNVGISIRRSDGRKEIHPTTITSSSEVRV